MAHSSRLTKRRTDGNEFLGNIDFPCNPMGNAFAEIQRDGAGRVVAMYVLLPGWVQVQRIDGKLTYLVNVPGLESVSLAPSDCLHLHGSSFDGILGYRLSQMGKHSIGAMLAVEDFRSHFFKNGAQLSGVLSCSGPMPEGGFGRLEKSFRDRHAGTKNSHLPLILEDGITYTPNQSNPEQSQLLETLNFSVEECARWLRISPNKLFSMVRAQG